MPNNLSRVFVGNLPDGCSIRDVEKFFRGYGKIRSVILKSTKYGFVDFYSFEDADKAVCELDGHKLKGNRIPVEHGKGIRKVQSGNHATWTTKYGTLTRTEYKMRVENLSNSINWQDLKDIMRRHGEVTFAEAHKEKNREGLVEFSTEEDLNRAYSRTNGQRINGRRIQCFKLYEPRPRSRSWSRFEEAERSRSNSKEKSNSKERSISRPKEVHMPKERPKDLDRLKSRERSKEIGRSVSDKIERRSTSKRSPKDVGRSRSKSLDGSVSPIKKAVNEENECDKDTSDHENDD